MTIPLTGSDEQYEYRIFTGRYIDQITQLIALGYQPLSLAEIIEKRMSAPDEVSKVWRYNCFDSTDGIARGVKGDAIIGREIDLLYKLTPKKPVSRNALTLTLEEWEDLKGRKDFLHLTANQVAQANNKGYIFKNNKWEPENKIVEELWTFLAKKQSLRDYLSWIGSRTSERYKIMELSFDDAERFSPTLQPWHIHGFGNLSRIGNSSLHYPHSAIVGMKKKPEDQNFPTARRIKE